MGGSSGRAGRGGASSGSMADDFDVSAAVIITPALLATLTPPSLLALRVSTLFAGIEALFPSLLGLGLTALNAFSALAVSEYGASGACTATAAEFSALIGRRFRAINAGVRRGQLASTADGTLWRTEFADVAQHLRTSGAFERATFQGGGHRSAGHDNSHWAGGGGGGGWSVAAGGRGDGRTLGGDGGHHRHRYHEDNPPPHRGYDGGGAAGQQSVAAAGAAAAAAAATAAAAASARHQRNPDNAPLGELCKQALTPRGCTRGSACKYRHETTR